MTVADPLPRVTLTSILLLSACAAATARAPSWTFDELLRPPTPDEIRRVDQDWARKLWTVGDATLVGTTTVPVGAERFEARLYTHTLNNSRRCGAVIAPPGAAPRSLAGLLDIGDVRWDYADRELTTGPYVASILAERAREFALIVPCARGTGIRVGDIRVEADGDRRDAWEGVAEDAMAFLTAAVGATPQIDVERLAAYGYSRGGGVALIVGQRDPRIRAVLAFAGPTDWFLRDWESLPLPDLRRRLVGASPLYFVDKLPPFQVHHGVDDRPVPVRNATALRDRQAQGNMSGQGTSTMGPAPPRRHHGPDHRAGLLGRARPDPKVRAGWGAVIFAARPLEHERSRGRSARG